MGKKKKIKESPAKPDGKKTEHEMVDYIIVS